MTDREADMKQHIHKVHEPALEAKITTNWYVKENAWLDPTSSWSIKDVERRFKTLPERHTGSSFELLFWMIIYHTAEDPRSKNNAFRVPPYVSPEWHIMLNRDKYTIKDMLKDVTSEEDSQPSSQTASKKRGRKRKNRRAKSKAVIESSDSDDIDDDHSSKLHGQRRVESSLKPREGSQSSETELKTITMDRSLLISERVESGQTEFDE